MAFLLNRITGQPELAEILTPIGAVDLACYESDWKPVLDGKIDELKRAGQHTREQVAKHNVEDAHWEWPAKSKDRSGQLQWNSFAIRCNGSTQGLMFVNLVYTCRLDSQLNKHMVYVDLLSTAPWNRPRLSPQPLYRGVGGALISEAIRLSEAEEWGGRIGLHALPGAEQFYRDDWKMVSLGPDPNYSNLHYFEMTTERATEFLSE